MNSRQVSWTALKSMLDSKGIKAQGLEDSDSYLVLAIDGSLVFETTLLKSNKNDDLADFEANYKPTWNPVLAPRDPILGREIVSLSAFSVNSDYEVKSTGFKGTAAAGVTTNIDHAIGAEDRYINGVAVYTEGAVMGDTLNFYVVDKDRVYAGVLYPDVGSGEVVLKQFGYTWNIFPAMAQQAIFNYLARIPLGVYVRLAYTSTGGDQVKVACNLFLHKKVAA